MKDNYFKLEEDFESIIKNALDIKGEKIQELKFIPTGWTNIVYEAKTDANSYFFRFPRDEFWSRTIVKDYEFGKYIHGKTNFNTIQLEILYDNSRPYSMHKKISGTPLAEKMNDLSDEQIEKVSNDIANFMYQLHSLNFDKNNIFTVNNIGLELNSFLDELLKKHVSSCDIKFWNPSNNLNTNFCLVHGDLNSSNIILDDNNNIAGVIDFGFGGFGNKYDDIARIIGRCPLKFKEAIIKNYENYSNTELDEVTLNNSIDTWSNIDNSYINYMRKIGIYE